MLEVYSIKERLARDGQPCNLKILKKALLIPDEPLRVPGTFQYPSPGVNLMINPDKKVKKKKKKGKKKKWNSFSLARIYNFNIFLLYISFFKTDYSES